MPPRPTIPADDLYARLELPTGASIEAVEVAWRALLKRHHPDVAGESANELAKQINVAHDWLTDPDLRLRYDRERHPELGRGGSGRVRRSAAWTDPGGPPRRAAPVRRRRPWPADPAAMLDRFLARVDRLSSDELDRLSLAESPPIAFVASIGRFLSPERLAAVESAERRVVDHLPRRARWDAPTRDAVLGAAHEIVLHDFLDEYLDPSFRERVRERLTRGWEAAIDQPRYGPNTNAVARFVARARDMTPDELRALVAAGGRGPVADDPWPRGLDPADHEGLRVSSTLAGRDAGEAPALATLDRTASTRARRLLGRTAHAFVLRHAFPAARYDELVAPWRAATGDPGTGRVGGAAAGVRVERH